MKGIALHPLTRTQIESILLVPAQSLALIGPPGIGKLTLAQQLASGILNLSPGQFEAYAYKLVISGEGSIGIEAVRQLEHFLSLKVPGQALSDRVVIIENAHNLTLEAQNALLKTLEEPPAGTHIILTVSHPQALLPTINSRLQAVSVKKPGYDNLLNFFEDQGHDQPAINQAYSISGGLPGLMEALLNEADHPLLLATTKARQWLGSNSYEKLLMADELAKQKALALDVAFILQQMAHIGLKNSQAKSARRWQNILDYSFQAVEALNSSAQPKLVLSNLALNT